MNYYYFHSTDGKTGLEGLRNFPKITGLIDSRAGIILLLFALYCHYRHEKKDTGKQFYPASTIHKKHILLETLSLWFLPYSIPFKEKGLMWHFLNFPFTITANPSTVMCPQASSHLTFLSQGSQETYIWWGPCEREGSGNVIPWFICLGHDLWSQSHISTLDTHWKI